MISINQFTDFALKYKVHSSAVYTLPALFERAAGMVHLSEDEFYKSAMNNMELGKYLAECAYKVSKEDA